MNLILTEATLAPATAAMADPPTDKTPPKATPTEIQCAVLKNKVKIKDATAKKMYADYKGNRYVFCCDKCPTVFNKDQAKFAKAPHIPTPKPDQAPKGDPKKAPKPS